MKTFLTSLHRLVGFPLGLLFVVTFGTGSLTAIDELIHRVEQVQFNTEYQYRDTTIEEDARSLEYIIEGKKGLRQLVLPTEDTPYYQVVARGERWVYPIDHLENERHISTNNEGFFRTVLQLHRNYLLGKECLFSIEGSNYVAWVGVISFLLSVLGLWLWWPKRRSFVIKDVVPQGRRRKHFYINHMTGGVVVLALIVLLSLTGASITYRSIAQGIFGVERDKAPTIEAVDLEPSWQAWLSAAYTNMPEGSTLEVIRFPRQPRNNNQRKQAEGRGENTTEQKNRNLDKKESKNATPQILEFRFHTSGDWFGLTGSKVKIDKRASTLVDVSPFSTMTFTEKFYTLLVPLHTGHHLPAAYVVLLLMLSLLGTVMVFSGIASFIMKKRKWLRRPSIPILRSS